MNTEEHRTVWEGKYLRIKVCGRWEYAERPNSPAGIVIVAVTDQDNLLLIEQFRVPVGKKTIELPAGLAGDDHYTGEAYLEAAKRELREETGYEADRWEELTQGPPSAGLSNEMVAFFRAKDLRKIGEGGGDEAEQIRVHHVPLAELRPWLRQKAQEGLLIDPKIFAGLYFVTSE